MSSRFYRRGWDETRGDEFDGRGCSVWYFEADDDGWPVADRGVCTGPFSATAPGVRKTNSEGWARRAYDSDDDWSRFEIAREEFERVWNSDRENQPC